MYKEEKAGPKPALVKVISGSVTTIQATDDGDEDSVESDFLINKMLVDIQKKESQIPWLKFLVLVLLEIGMVVLILLKGGNGSSIVGIECGSWQYWALVAASFPYLAIFVAIFAKVLNVEHEKKLAVGFDYLKEDLKWNFKTILLFLVFAVVAGIAAGFLGIGGGLITGPVLLEMGVIPQVAVATSSYMILFTSSATTFQFFILGRLPWRYAVWYFFVGLLAAVAGQYGVAKILEKYKKQAFINFLLASIIVISVVLVLVIEGMNLYSHVKNHDSMGFHPICKSI